MSARYAIESVVVGLFVSVASADILDQDNLAPNFNQGAPSINTGQSAAETFTVGVSGTLSRIDVQIWKSTGTTGDVTLRILSTTAGVPDPMSSGTLLTAVISIAGVPVDDGLPDADTLPLTTVDVSAAALVVNSGDQLAISLSRTGPGSPPWVQWGRVAAGAYAGGEGFISSNGETWNSDFGRSLGFRTWVILGPCPWDCGGDDNDDVGIVDFLALLAQWGGPGSCDFDGGGIGITDFLELLANWGPCP